MNIFCKRQEFEKILFTVARFTGTKSGSDVLDGILLEAKNGLLELKSYNLDLGITTKFPVDAKIEGSVVLPSKILCDISKKSAGDQIEIDVAENFSSSIKSGDSKFLVAGLDPLSYPDFPSVENLEKIRIDAEKLGEMAKQTVFASSSASSESDPVYTGVLFEIKDKKIRLIALDGYRMAARTENIKSDKKAYFIIPAKSLSEISKLAIDVKKDASITVGKNHALFEFSEFKIVSRLIEGKFLDYDSSIPKSFSTEVLVSSTKLTMAIERVMLVTTDATKTPAKLVFNENTLKVFCFAGCGKASDEIKVEIKGNPLEIGVNGKYLLDAIKNSGSDQIKLQMSGPLSPVKITPKSTEEFVFLVLPVRLKTEETAV